jgi:hypothetical protein
VNSLHADWQLTHTLVTKIDAALAVNMIDHSELAVQTLGAIDRARSGLTGYLSRLEQRLEGVDNQLGAITLLVTRLHERVSQPQLRPGYPHRAATRAPSIRAEAGELGQIALQRLGNALNTSPTPNQMAVALAIIFAQATGQDPYVAFTVAVLVLCVARALPRYVQPSRTLIVVDFFDNQFSILFAEAASSDVRARLTAENATDEWF